MTNDTLNTYTYDAENRMTTVNGTGAVYTYDGSALRIKKVASGTTTTYIYSGTKVIAEYVGGTLDKEYIYLGSQLLATIDKSVSPEVVTYHHNDHLSARVSTDSAGAKVGEQAHYPFGENWLPTTGSPATKWDFTNYERDSESGLNYATFRYDSSRLGRFMTPDPIAGSIANPQSLNRYAYVHNDPINKIDPLGLVVWENERGEQWVCQETPETNGEVFVGCIQTGFGGDGGGGGGGGGGGVFSGHGSGKLKKKLEDALKNPDCAALVGGTQKAAELMKNLNKHIIDVTPKGFNSKKYVDLSTREVKRLRSGNRIAATGPGIGRNIYVGTIFNALEPNQQATVIIHEFRHQVPGLSGLDERGLSPAGKEASSIVENELITGACETGSAVLKE